MWSRLIGLCLFDSLSMTALDENGCGSVTVFKEHGCGSVTVFDEHGCASVTVFEENGCGSVTVFDEHGCGSVTVVEENGCGSVTVFDQKRAPGFKATFNSIFKAPGIKDVVIIRKTGEKRKPFKKGL